MTRKAQLLELLHGCKYWLDELDLTCSDDELRPCLALDLGEDDLLDAASELVETGARLGWRPHQMAELLRAACWRENEHPRGRVENWTAEDVWNEETSGITVYWPIWSLS